MLDRGGRHLLQDNLHHLHQRCDDKDECQRLQVLQAKGIEHIHLDEPGDDSSQSHHKRHSRTHTQRGVHFLGNTKEGADAQELRKDDIVDKYR